MTLIELMIVVAIIGVLAAVAIPKYSSMMEKSREGATRGNFGSILSAVSMYYADNRGVWPDDISAVAFTKYIGAIPAVKVTHPNGGNQLSGVSNAVEINTTNSAFSASTDGWRYNPNTGGIWVNNSQTDSAGTVYSMYGYD